MNKLFVKDLTLVTGGQAYLFGGKYYYLAKNNTVGISLVTPSAEELAHLDYQGIIKCDTEEELKHNLYTDKLFFKFISP